MMETIRHNQKERKPMTSIVKNSITVAGIEFTPLYNDLIPDIAVEEYQTLKQDIQENGILIPIFVDEHHGVIDGIQRLKVAAELGLKKIPFQIYPNLSESEKKELALKVNAIRRHWSTEDRINLAKRLRKEAYSLRRIADILNLSHETVRRHLAEVSDTEDMPDTVVGKDGFRRAAKGKTRPCIMINGVTEAKKVYGQLASAESLDLPNRVVDAKGLSRTIQQQKYQSTSEDCADIKIGSAKLGLGFFEEKGKDIADESVDLVLTDPPYSETALPVWDSLGKLAQRILKPGGILLSYSGAMYLPEIHQAMGKHLAYFWTFAVKHTGGNTFVRQLNLQQTFKPVLGYFKPPLNVSWDPFLDMVSGGRSKDNHVWEQPVEESRYFIKNLCPKGGVVCDPMMGSGTVIIASISLGMTAIGIDQDTTAFTTARERIREFTKKLETKVA